MKKLLVAIFMASAIATGSPALAATFCNDEFVTEDTYFSFWKAARKLTEYAQRVSRKNWPSDTYLEISGGSVVKISGSWSSAYQFSDNDVLYENWCRHE